MQTHSFFVLCLIGCSLAFLPRTTAAQCTCADVLQELIQTVESNYAGFRDKVNNRTGPKYDQLKDRVQGRAEFARDETACFVVQQDYLDFFRDQHLQLAIAPDPDVPQQGTALQEYFADWPRLETTEERVREEIGNRPHDRIEGIYQLGTDYRIAVLKRPTERRQYVGIILESETPFWTPGQIKMEIGSADARGRHRVLFYMRDHSLRVSTGQLEEGGQFIVAGIGDWERLFPVPTRKTGLPEVPVEPYFDDPFAIILADEQTTLLRIGSFSEQYAARLDSLLTAFHAEIVRRPNLLIDLRDNGGGSDFSYQPLLPYLYTDTIFTVGMSVLASPANIAAWSELLDEPTIPDALKDELRQSIEEMRSRKNTFIDFPDDTTYLPAVLPRPSRIAVLINENCGSTTEQFLLAARQSDKVTLYGQPTAGVLDYANMREAKLSCDRYQFYYATSRSRRLPHAAIDNIGIAPDHPLPPGTDWIGEVRRLWGRE